jgi:hypothetical protein
MRLIYFSLALLILYQFVESKAADENRDLDKKWAEFKVYHRKVFKSQNETQK